MSEKENSSKELVIVDAEWSESEEGGQGDGSSRVHVMSGSERRSYETKTGSGSVRSRRVRLSVLMCM